MSLIAEQHFTKHKDHLIEAARARLADTHGGDHLIVVKKVDGRAWDLTAAEFDGVVQEQLYAYAKTRWPGARHEPLVFYRDGEIVGGTLMMVQPLPLHIGAIALSKWGPILKDVQRPDAEALYSAMIDQLVEIYGRQRGVMLSVLPRAATGEYNYQYDHLLSRGFKPGTGLLFPNRYIVDLRLSDEAQRKSFAQKWRYHLNKSEKAGLGFEHAGVERMDEFETLYHAMTDRKNFADHSAYMTVHALLASDAPALRPELFFVRHEGEVVAGAIIFKAGDTAVYLFGATNERALPLRAGYFLHWHVIRWLRDNTKARWYDLGGTEGFHGLHQFKKGMVGDAGVISQVPPGANYSARKLSYFIGTRAFAARELLRRTRNKIELAIAGKAKPDQQRPDAGETRNG